VERIGEGIRRSLRADEMDGSISQAEISGGWDKTGWWQTEHFLLTDISAEKRNGHMKWDCWNNEITDSNRILINNICQYSQTFFTQVYGMKA
jgi:hypothetical protein